MAKDPSPLNDETLAVCRLIATIEKVEGAAMGSAVRFPKSDAIGRAAAGLAQVRQRLLDTLMDGPDRQQALAYIAERSSAWRNGVALLSKLHADAIEPTRETQPPLE